MGKKILKINETELKNIIKKEASKIIFNENRFKTHSIYDNLREEVDSSFKRHLFIEFFYNNEKNFLVEQLSLDNINEQYGVPNECEKMTRVIISSLDKDKHINNIEIKNSWVKNIKIIHNGNPNVIASYLPYDSLIYSSTNNDSTTYFYNPLTITLNYTNSNNKEIFVALMHEITHAYEDYCRRIRNKETLISNGIKYGYNKNRIQTDDVNEYIISKILYYTYRVERNAFIASMVGELKHSNKHFSSIGEVLDFIRNTNTYGNYMNVINWINDFIDITDKDIQNEALKYIQNLSNLKFKTYRQFEKYLIKKKYEIINKFNKIIPKIAYEHLNTGGLMLQEKLTSLNNNFKVRKTKT